MVAATIRPLVSILWWILIGNWIKFVYVYVHSTYFRRYLLPTFSTSAPQWWLDTWVLYYWWSGELVDGVPSYTFGSRYAQAAHDRFSDWVGQAADNVARPLTDAIYGLLGNLMYGYSRFTDWINAIWVRVGPNVPSWASNMMEALWTLWWWFPEAIRNNVSTWYDRFLYWYNLARDWAYARYEDTRVWVANTGSWLVSGYNTVRAWYDASYWWLDDFRYNIYDRITAWLGPPWYFLAGAWWELQNFYNNIWIPYRATLHNFLSDPLGWLYDRVEAELVRRW